MALWKVRGKGWRYEFQVGGKRYTGAWFQTKAGARSKREAHKKEVEAGVPKPTPTTFLAVAGEYLEHAQRRFAKKTWKYKESVYRAFYRHAGNLCVVELGLSVIESYLRSRPTNINYNRHRKDLCALLTWAWRRGYIAHNPCFFLEKMPEPPFIRDIPSREELARIILAAGEERPFLLFVYHTMARLDEALRAKWEDINFQDRVIRLWTRKRKDGSWASDLIPMNRVLYEVLWGLWQTRQQDLWVFHNPKTGDRYVRRPKLMQGICRRAGVPYYGFHALRHFVASRLHDEKKWSLAKVSRLLRHQEKRTTERYLQVIDPDLRVVMASLEDGFFEIGRGDRS